jgi:hypothetical protein
MLRKILTYLNLVKEPVWEIVDLFNSQEVKYARGTALTCVKDVEIAVSHINFDTVIVRKGYPWSGTPTEFVSIEAWVLDRIVVKAKKAMLDKQKQDEANYNLVCRKELTDFLKEK